MPDRADGSVGVRRPGAGHRGRPPEIVVLTGPNGSGRSTVRRLLVGELRSLGRLELDLDRPMSELTRASSAVSESSGR
ncbi:ATP-binding cassette domain-containing protein [Kribbella speibonae]|uniref:ATP-binding cassette domain-containing protein n=1 Tax=Kribbella speibonae TaxID=1572660 RepID=A0A4V2M3M9_9ACTN|nr:ATP-binding cassette domain-containing protein [Kribbella speibonae]TCC32662.1 ATP-binding cassette domain-containing protein [Kribbella speibonae]